MWCAPSRRRNCHARMTALSDASDPQADLLGSINRIYGVPGRVEPAGITRHLRLYHGLRRGRGQRDASNKPPIAAAPLPGGGPARCLPWPWRLQARQRRGDDGELPEDYRLRHPIAIQEADRSVVVFVGHGRGGLSAQQRADVICLAQTWLGEGTGGIRVDVPVNTPNARTAEDSFRKSRRRLPLPACRRAQSSASIAPGSPAHGGDRLN